MTERANATKNNRAFRIDARFAAISQLVPIESGHAHRIDERRCGHDWSRGSTEEAGQVCSTSIIGQPRDR